MLGQTGGKQSRTIGGMRRAGSAVAAPVNRYPAMNHGNLRGKKPTRVTPAMRRSIAGNIKVKKLYGYNRLGGALGRSVDLFATDKTMKIPSRKINGADNEFRTMNGTTNKAGIMMGMNMRGRIVIHANNAITQLRSRFPMAVKRGIVAASDLVGRKMLDIIEPYVPKDHGYLYQSAKSNADQGYKGMISFANGTAFPGSETYGVTISYNTPYAEIVYFGGDRHGAAYNAAHGTQEKGTQETARWIEVAMSQKPMEFRNLLSIYAIHVTAALNSSSATRGMTAGVR